MAINADGVVVGTLSDPSSKRKRPFRWINGSLSELPLVDEEACAAAAINSKNQIVGGCQLATGLSAACLWTESGVVNLNDLVPAGSGWHLVSADDINDRGEITGTGYIATEMHAFFLSPRMPPEPRVDPED
jgi:uncharacterized membrane protein